VREKPIRAESNYLRIPAEIIERNRSVEMVADVMFVCGLPFVITLSADTLRDTAVRTS